MKCWPMLLNRFKAFPFGHYKATFSMLQCAMSQLSQKEKQARLMLISFTRLAVRKAQLIFTMSTISLTLLENAHLAQWQGN